MNILYVASEAAPFIKTGGLADVAGSLPQELNKIGDDCRVVIPLYETISEEYRKDMKQIAYFYVDLGWKHEYCGVYEYRLNNTIFYFLDNEFYFKRFKIYGHGDDAERFVFFSKAAVRLPKIIDFNADIIHANDWHTALVPVFVNDYRTGDSFYDNVRTILTIHNLKYQGQFGQEIFAWTNLPGYFMSDYDLKFYDSISFLKGGIVHANAVNTVSKTYAEEILYPFFGEGLQSVIQAYKGKLSGIVNGIDEEIWNPKKDKYLKECYDIKSVDKKAENKLEIQKRYGLPVRENVPMVVMISRLTEMKGLDLVRYILEEFLQDDVQFVVLGTGDYTYEEMFKYFEYKYPEKCAARIYYSNEESHLLYSAADLFLMPSVSEPCGLSQMIAMRYGTLPIVREAGGLRDTVESYNKYENTGDGFSFSNINAHDLLFTLRNAVDIYRNNKKAYKMLQTNAMTKDFSWKKSAKEYQNLYKSVLF